MDALLWALLIAGVVALVLWFRNRTPVGSGSSPENAPAAPEEPVTKAELPRVLPTDSSGWESKASEAVVRRNAMRRR